MPKLRFWSAARDVGEKDDHNDKVIGNSSLFCIVNEKTRPNYKNNTYLLTYVYFDK